jgi:hypothetical protein
MTRMDYDRYGAWEYGVNRHFAKRVEPAGVGPQFAVVRVPGDRVVAVFDHRDEAIAERSFLHRFTGHRFAVRKLW